MIKRAIEGDAEELACLAVLLWDNHGAEELRDEFADMLKSDEAACFIAYESDVSVGFAQCQLRHDYVEGTTTSPVGYLEGIYVMPEYQNHGLAKQLIGACESWAREKGCTEFASDCELSNDAGFSFHLSMGFTEVNRIICFRKTLYDRSME